jgi:hypothetical protein
VSAPHRRQQRQARELAALSGISYQTALNRLRGYERGQAREFLTEEGTPFWARALCPGDEPGPGARNYAEPGDPELKLYIMRSDGKSLKQAVGYNTTVIFQVYPSSLHGPAAGSLAESQRFGTIGQKTWDAICEFALTEMQAGDPGHWHGLRVLLAVLDWDTNRSKDERGHGIPWDVFDEFDRKIAAELAIEPSGRWA